MSLNKFNWGGFLKKLVAIASIICPAVGLILEAAAFALGNNKMTFENLDPNDALILSEWDTKKFTPFYTSLLHTVEKNVINGTNNEVRAQFANEVFLKIDAVKSYYSVNENIGLTPKGISARLEYINDSLNAIITAIMDLDLALIYNSVKVEQNFQSIELSLLQIPSNVDFTVTSSLFELSKDIEVLTPSQETVTENPPLSIQEIEEVINTATQNNSSSPKPNNDVNTTYKYDKTAIAKVVGILLIAIGLMSSSKSKSKSE